jgi:hypothetical protein
MSYTKNMAMKITHHIIKIIDLIKENPAVNIVCPLGIGQNIAIPASIAIMKSRCFVLTDKVEDAALVCRYGASNSSSVGYANENMTKYNESTNIVYVTGSYLRHKMLTYFSEGYPVNIDFCDVILINKAKMGSVDADIVISLWASALTRGVQAPRLVLIGQRDTSSDISILTKNLVKPVVYTITINPKIPVIYSKNNYEEDECYGQIIEIIKQIDNKKLGNTAIIMPNIESVEKLYNRLKECTKTLVIRLSNLTKELLNTIYDKTKRKVIIGTEVTLALFHLNDISNVIDSTRDYSINSSKSGGLRKSISYISKETADDRLGFLYNTETSETLRCYRLCTYDKFMSFQDADINESLRVPINDIIMELLEAGLNPINELKTWDKQNLNYNIKLLTKLGFIVSGQTSDTEISTLGKLSKNLILSARTTAFIWRWINEGYTLFPGIVIASIIDCYGPSYFLFDHTTTYTNYDNFLFANGQYVKQYKNPERSNFFDKYSGNNDLETALNIWHDLVSNMKTVSCDPIKLKEWCHKNRLNYSKMLELSTTVLTTITTLRKLGHKFTIGPFTTEGSIKFARPILLNIYSDCTFIHKRDLIYFNPVSKEEYKLDTKESVNTMINKPPSGVIALSTCEIKSRNVKLRETIKLVTFGIDTDKDGLGRVIFTRKQLPKRSQDIVTRRKKLYPQTMHNNVEDLDDLSSLQKELNLKPTSPYTQDKILEATNLLSCLPAPTKLPKTLYDAKVESTGSLLNLVTILIEYYKYWYVDKMVKTINTITTNKNVIDVVKNWLITLAQKNDDMFVVDGLAESSSKLSSNLNKIGLQASQVDNIVNKCLSLVNDFLSKDYTNEEQISEPIISKQEIIINAFRSIFPGSRLCFLKKIASPTEIGIMCLKYSSLDLITDSIKNIPVPIYDLLVTKYHYDTESFTTPLTNQITKVKESLKYTSFFDSLDISFGSLGKFNANIINGRRTIINLLSSSYSAEILDIIYSTFETVEFLSCCIHLDTAKSACFEKNKYLLPSGPTSREYSDLSKYFKCSFTLGPNDYYYVTKSGNLAIPSEASTVILLSKGFTDNYDSLESEIRQLYLTLDPKTNYSDESKIKVTHQSSQKIANSILGNLQHFINPSISLQ